MFPSHDDRGESFRGQLLLLRGRIGLTQLQFADQIDVHVNSIQSWEAGLGCPSAASLRRLIAAVLRLGGFSLGREQREASELWMAAQDASPRLRTPFDPTWFQGLLGAPESAEAGVVEDGVVWLPSANRGARRQSWGDAPDVGGFLGRESERALLSRWVLEERSRLVALLGLGGIGKSLLAARVAYDLAPSFTGVFWRSLRDAPTPDEWLAEAIGFLAPNDPVSAQPEAARVSRLFDLLRDVGCLLVLDNFETVLQPGSRAGDYRPGYERFGTILRQVAETPHQSCVILTSREEPLELGPLRGARGAVRTIALTGLRVEDGRALLDDKWLDGDDAAWQALVDHCGGNALALKVVGDTTREVFGGSIADFLAYATSTPGVVVGGVRQLLMAQIQRLSERENDVLRCMAVARESVGFADLTADLSPRIGRAAALDAVEGLRRRSLLERIERGPQFGLHSVVLEYITEQLIEDVVRELATGEPDLVLRQPLLRASGKEYVRRSQERLICAPLLERLVERCGGAEAAEQRLCDLLDRLRGRPRGDHGYGPGNIANLLRLLRGDLKGVNLSGLVIRQAYLQDVEVHGASLAGAHLSETMLGEAFSFPMPALAFSADGAYLVAGMTRGEVCLWEVTPRTLLATLQGHVGAAIGVAISADGRLVASGGSDGTVRLWRAADGHPLATLQAHVGGVWDVALSDDGGLLASAGIDGVVGLWESDAGRQRAALHGHEGGVWRVALSGDGRLVASGGADGTVRLWRAADGRSLATLEAHPGGVWGVALSDDGRLVASGGEDGTVRLWAGGSGEPLATLRGHAGGVRGVSLDRDGRLVASTGVDGTLRLWETERGQPLPTLHGHTGAVRGGVLSKDGRLVASCGADGTVQLSEAGSGRQLAVLRGKDNGILSLSLSRDGRLAASGSDDGTVRLRDVASGRPLATLRTHAGSVRGVALGEDGRLLASGGFDGMVRLWEVESGRLLATLSGHAGEVNAVALSGDGRLLASAGVDTTVRLWEARSGRALAILAGHTGFVWSVALSEDGQLVASGGVDGTVHLWDAQAGLPRATLQGHTGLVFGVAITQDGHLVASGGMDRTVRLWEAASGRMLAALHGHDALIASVGFSGDGRLVVAGGVDGTVRLWEVDGGRQVATLRGHSGRVGGVALSEDGGLVVSGGVDGTVRFWDGQTGDCLRVSRDDRRYEQVNIAGLTGVTDAQRQVLISLGAVERSSS